MDALTAFGLLAVTAMLVTYALTLRPLAVGRGSPGRRMFIPSVARAMLVAMVGFAFASLFLSTQTDRTLWLLFGFALALPRVAASAKGAVP